MTLATVERYDPGGIEGTDGHAVVVGGSMAGLCTARVLDDWFERVTVVERDPLPDEPASRRGVPQGRHVHVLQEAGRATLEDLFPGFGEDVLSAGGLLLDGSSEVDFYVEGDFLADGTHRQAAYAATRPLFEHVVGQRVAGRDGIELRTGCQFIDFLTADGGGAVEGVELQPEDGGPTELAADLVVDATGRTSRTPEWLSSHGYEAPPVDEVHIDVAYSTTFIERPPAERHGVVVTPEPDQPRGGAALPVEDGRWLVTLWGMNGETPPTDWEGFVEFTETLPVPHVHRLLERYPRVSDDIAHYPFPSNLRRRYEALDRFPDGLVVLGDAVASFNPIYGQGMSVAALEAVELGHVLAEDAGGAVGPRFFDRAESLVDIAWNMAVGGDHQFPGTEGPKPAGTDVLNWYLSRLIRRAHTDSELFDAFFEVQNMVEPPTSLLRPGVVWRVFRPGA